MSTVIGVFGSEAYAERAVRALKDQGFGGNEISIVSKGGREDDEDGELSMGGGGNDITSGAVSGGALGGIAGLLAGVGALAIPGLGPIVAAGPIAAALSGAVAGGLAGGLVDWGIPESRGRYYADQVKAGQVLALVKTGSDRVEKAAGVLRGQGAHDVEVH